MDIIGKTIAVEEAARLGLYDGAMRTDPEYQKLTEEIGAKVKVGWLKRLTAAMLGKKAEMTVAQALEAAGHPLPPIVALRGDYRVHDEWLVHEVAQWISYMATKPTPIEMIGVARQRRNFHRQHQFKGFTQIKPRGTSRPSLIPVWVLNR